MPTRKSAAPPAAQSGSARATLTRRDFVRLLGVGTAAAGVGVVTPPARAAEKAATTSKGKAAAKPTSPAFTAEQHKEIARQAGQVDGALKKIRAYKLPAGSEPATRFLIIRPRGGGKRA